MIAAAMYGHTGVVELLLAHGADVMSETTRGVSVALAACKAPRMTATKLAKLPIEAINKIHTVRGSGMPASLLSCSRVSI